MAVGSSTSAEFNKKLLSNDISLEPSFIDQLYGTILYLYPKAKPSGVDGAISKMDVASTLQQSQQYVWDVQNDQIERRFPWTLLVRRMWMCVLPMTFRETVHTVAVVTRRIICIVPALAVPTVIVPARILVVILVVILAPILIILAPILIIPPPILIILAPILIILPPILIIPPPILIIPPPILITPILATPITQPDPLKSMPFMTES